MTCDGCSGPADNECTTCHPSAGTLNPPAGPGKCDCGTAKYFDEPNLTCTDCHESCQECAGGGPSDCTACKANSSLIFISPSTKGPCLCDAVHYFDNTAHVCTACGLGCEVCTPEPASGSSC